MLRSAPVEAIRASSPAAWSIASTAGEPPEQAINRHLMLPGGLVDRLDRGQVERRGHRGFVFHAASFGDRSVPRVRKSMPNRHEKTTDGRFA